MSDGWIKACQADDIAPEDVIRFDHAGKTYAIYRSEDDQYFATDGLCTHGQTHLAEGLVQGSTIECPKHNGRFDFVTGECRRAPVRIPLKTYATKIDGGAVFIKLG